MLLNLIFITSLLLKFTRAHFTFETKLGNLGSLVCSSTFYLNSKILIKSFCIK